MAWGGNGHCYDWVLSVACSLPSNSVCLHGVSGPSALDFLIHHDAVSSPSRRRVERAQVYHLDDLMMGLWEPFADRASLVDDRLSALSVSDFSALVKLCVAVIERACFGPMAPDAGRAMTGLRKCVCVCLCVCVCVCAW